MWGQGPPGACPPVVAGAATDHFAQQWTEWFMVFLMGLFEPHLGRCFTDGSVVSDAPVAARFVTAGALVAAGLVLPCAQAPVGFGLVGVFAAAF